MKRREEIDLLQRTLERLMNLIEDENSDTPTKDELLTRVGELSEAINTMSREMKESGNRQMFTLWLALRHVPGCHAIITQHDQIASGGMLNDALKVIRYDDPTTADAHFIAIDFGSDTGPELDFTNIPRDALRAVGRHYESAALSLYDEWEKAEAGRSSVNEDYVRSVVDGRFGEGSYDLLKKVEADEQAQTGGVAGSPNAADAFAYGLQASPAPIEDPASDAAEVDARTVADAAIERITIEEVNERSKNVIIFGEFDRAGWKPGIDSEVHKVAAYRSTDYVNEPKFFFAEADRGFFEFHWSGYPHIQPIILAHYDRWKIMKEYGAFEEEAVAAADDLKIEVGEVGPDVAPREDLKRVGPPTPRDNGGDGVTGD